jgi:hypothetical protein
MAIPNYTYLNLKMLGLHEVITIGTSFQRAYECDVECGELATTTITYEELAVIGDEIIEADEVSDSKQSTRSFEPIEGTKEILIDPSSSEGRWCTSAPHFLPNRKACLSTSFARTETFLHGNPRICQAFQGKSPSMP